MSQGEEIDPAKESARRRREVDYASTLRQLFKLLPEKMPFEKPAMAFLSRGLAVP